MKTTYMETSDNCDNPIDLSRRCDSVETRKTPSPSDNSSSFVESSPSFENDLSTIVAARKKAIVARSDTPPNSYQSNKYTKRSYSSPSNPTERSYSSIKHESSPSSSPPQHVSHHHYKHELQHQQQQSQSINAKNDVTDSYVLHSAALHQKLQHIPVKASSSTPSSPESTTSSQYPMLRGRDGKLTRPFKIYKHDTFSNPFASIPSTTDLLADPLSDERYMAFRQQMLEQIYAANGGQPTITNPKMRRTTATVKSYAENESQSSQQNEREFQTQSSAQQQNSINCTSDSSEASCATNGKGPIKDSAYYERRRKNNAAAKKSRDRRREKEDNIVIRCTFLERENMLLKAELETARRQLARFVAP